MILSQRNVEIEQDKVTKRPDYSRNKAEERFQREIAVVKRLSHLGFVPRITEEGEDDKSPYYKQQRLIGINLDQVLFRYGAFTMRALPFFIEVGRRFGLVHEEGVVHRDINLSNLFIIGEIADCNPGILDFGTSNIADLMEGINTECHLLYSSPEQVRMGLDATDERSDIYSFGAVMYVAFSGTSPHRSYINTDYLQDLLKFFDGDDEAEPLNQRVESVPGLVNDAIMRCLRRDPDERYQSMDEVVEGLEASMEEVDEYLQKYEHLVIQT